MESKVYLRKGKIGMPQQVVVKIDNGIVTITSKDGTELINAQVASLSEPGQGTGFITFKVNDEYFSLDFIEPWKKLFGLLGIFVFGSSEIAEAKKWRTALESQGLMFSKRLI